MLASPAATPDRLERAIAIAIGVLALGFHAWGVSVGWHNASLPGNEFRQTQTAITALFVQRDRDFSLAYPTPVLGKPWSIPFEFPLYQWTVVVVSDVTGLSLMHAGRAVSIACFYLALPAIWLLLGRLGLAPTRRMLVLAAVLTCPLYVFYARAFLIETMALMFSLWFLQAYVAAVERRSWGWLVVANVAGLGAGLVKVTTFMLYLIPAGAWSLAWLWQARPRPGGPGGGWSPLRWTAGGWSPLRRTAVWIAAATAIPFAATYGWIRFADAVKMLNPSSRNLTSAATNAYNFGTWDTRFASVIWRQHGEIVFSEVISATVLAVIVALGLLFAGRWRRWIAWCVGLFMAVQVMFPILYAWHGYYYVANAVLLMTAAGLVLCGLIESATPRGIVWILGAGLYAGQIVQYLGHDYPVQSIDRGGPSELTRALQAVTEPDDVLVVAGEDWASMTPYYAQRRALMIRRDLEYDGSYLREVFGRLKGERVTVLVLVGVQRENRDLRELAVHDLDIDSRPVIAWANATVYLARGIRETAIGYLRHQSFINLRVVAEGEPARETFTRREVPVSELLPGQRQMFMAMSPAPVRFYSTFGLNLSEEQGAWVLSAHPDTRLWFRPAAGLRTIFAEFAMLPGSYENLAPSEATDGAEFAIYVQKADGTKRQVFDRLLNPADNPSDRGIQKLSLTVDLPPGAELVFETGPGTRNNYNRDWAAWGPIRIR